MKVAIVVGHSSTSKGAVGTDGVQEWDWHSLLADQLLELLPGSRVFFRPAGSYGRAMKKLTREVNAFEPSLVLSLHFNAFAEPAGVAPVHGTMALHWPGSTNGKRWARVLSRAVSIAIDTRDKGPREQARSWSGAALYILQDTMAPAVILETHYGDHPEDHRKATEGRDSGELARAIARAIVGQG